ncbi:TetR/AcrR family transcriptional regulator [Brachybacterium sp.]|uniref:TetR/AcrR family transcriptional regulator n=1 Tax=Brachybacterium sp. TaxID=1891286 RepID=UPI002ED5E1A8
MSGTHAGTPAEKVERPYHHGNLRDELLNAAEATLRERGQEDLSLRELARQIGVSHGAPRRHFADRQALLDALAITGFGRLHQALRAALEEADAGFPSRLRVMASSYVRFATDNAALLELMFTTKHRESAVEVREAAIPAFGLLHEVMVQGQGSGEVAPGDVEQVSIVLFATMQGIATLINGDMVDIARIDELTDQATEQFLRGNRAGSTAIAPAPPGDGGAPDGRDA